MSAFNYACPKCSLHVYGVWSCIMHSLDSFLTPLINAGFGAFKTFILWCLGWVVFCGQLLCQRQKVCSASALQAAVELFLVCIPDSFCLWSFLSLPQMKGGALSLRRWLRGRSLYCSKLLTARAKSRYLFLTYLLTLHLLLLLCLSGVLWAHCTPWVPPFPVGSASPSPDSSHAAVLPCTGHKSLGHYTESWASPVKFLHITLLLQSWLE